MMRKIWILMMFLAPLGVVAQETLPLPPLPLAMKCVILVMIQEGQICIKPDGNVEIPSNIEMDKLSKEFWRELAKAYPQILEFAK